MRGQKLQDDQNQQAEKREKAPQVNQVQQNGQGENIEFVIPQSKSQLRMCLQCGLAKTMKQWNQDKSCENCGTFLRMQKDQNIASKCNGFMALIEPGKSFIRKKAKIYARNGRKIIPALYGF